MADARLGARIHDLARPLGRRLAGTLRAEHPAVIARLGPAQRADDG
jgi:hypothetical protein